MTDNFEQFKFYEATPNHSNKQHSPTLLRQCKSLIKELHEQLIKTTTELDRKNSIIEQLIAEKDALKEKWNISEKSLQQAHRKNNQKDIQMDIMRRQCEQYQQQLKQNKNNLEHMNKELISMQNKINKMETNSKNYLHTIQQLKAKISLMEETIQLITNENENLSNMVQQHQQESNWQILQLKKYNEDLRKKAIIYEENAYQPNIHSSPPTQNPIRSSSTGRKKVSSETVHKPTNQHNLSRNTFISTFLPNPEIGKQLQNIKQQISKQYTKIEVRKQGINHERVNKTIAELEKKIGKMVYEVQKSDSQSCIQ